MQSATASLALATDRAESETAVPAASHFYEKASLQRLVSPVTEEEFRARHWERKPLIVHRENPNYYGDLFTLQAFDHSVRWASGYVKTAEATAEKVTKYTGTGPAALERILTDMRDGHTLILDGVQNHDTKLGQMCRMLGQETGCWYQANTYLTPPNGKGFTPHWDNHDVFVMQVLGRKHWKVEKNRRVLPERETAIEAEGRELRGEIYDFILEQGDVIYIPRGFVHAAECGSESSLHITLGVYPRTWDDLLRATIKATVLRDDNLRLALPSGYHKGDRAGVINRLGQELRKAADSAFLGQVLDQFVDELVQKAPLDISGQIVSFFEPKALTLDDKVGVRAGLCYTLRPHEETVTLKVGTRAITFPGFFGQALSFALETPNFAVRDLPGDLEDEEKLVFMERLMQEAVVVRT
jgi:ribosomal protein L16 Arg81 hydroxylase